MHSIHNFFQLQVFFSSNKGYNKAPILDFHNNRDEKGIPEYGSEWGKILSQTEGGPNTLYSIPRFDDTASIVAFIQKLEGIQLKQEKESIKNIEDRGEELYEAGIAQKTDISFEKQKEKIYQDIVLAFSLGQKYIKNQPRSYRTPMIESKVENIDDFIRFYKKFYKESQNNLNTKIYFCIFLKKVFAFLKIIRSQHFHIDYNKKTIDLRNKPFINSIIEIFNDKEIFSYEDEKSDKFGKTSERALGTALLDNKRINFESFFGVKSLERIVGKMSRDNRYTSIDAMKDLHRMRIKVEQPDDALRIAKLLFNKLGKNFEIRNKGNFITNEAYQLYANQYLNEQEDQEYKNTLEKALQNQEIKKSISAERQELRIARKTIDNQNPAIEIQIVLNNNFNETGGYAHHAIYEMKGLIEEIIHDKMYITLEHIRDVIRFYAEKDIKSNKGVSSIPFSEEQILNHILSSENFLVEIIKTDKQTNPSSRSRAFSTKKLLNQYVQNYPNTIESLPIARIKHTYHTQILELLNGKQITTKK